MNFRISETLSSLHKCHLTCHPWSIYFKSWAINWVTRKRLSFQKIKQVLRYRRRKLHFSKPDHSFICLWTRAWLCKVTVDICELLDHVIFKQRASRFILLHKLIRLSSGNQLKKLTVQTVHEAPSKHEYWSALPVVVAFQFVCPYLIFCW